MGEKLFQKGPKKVGHHERSFLTSRTFSSISTVGGKSSLMATVALKAKKDPKRPRKRPQERLKKWSKKTSKIFFTLRTFSRISTVRGKSSLMATVALKA